MEALTEALAKEVGPLGIKVTAIEPGAFRTDWAKRSMHESATPIEAYAEDVGARKELIKAFADHLPGDPRKVAEAVLMVVGLERPAAAAAARLGRPPGHPREADRDARLHRRVGVRHPRRELPTGPVKAP